jgi:hypothetical protein
MIEEKRKMDPPIKSEDDKIWVSKIDDTCQLSCPMMIYRGFEEILIGQPWLLIPHCLKDLACAGG